MDEPRQTRLRLLFTGDEKDVTQDVVADLLAWSYSDHETGQADEISLTLKDPEGKWAQSWRPDGGETIRMYLSAGTVSAPGPELFCGTFYVDSIRLSGKPSVVEIRATSIPLNQPIRKLAKSRAWEFRKLGDIAKTIAAEAKLELLMDVSEDPLYDRIDQDKESDLAFLKKLCEAAGLSLKVTDEKLVIFSQDRYEQKDPVASFVLGESGVLSYDFETAQSGSYGSVTVEWRDPMQKKKGSAASYNFNLEKVTDKMINPAVMSYTYRDPNAGPNDQEYKMRKRATSPDEAKRLAKAKLRQLNARRMTGSLRVLGDPFLVAGEVIECQGFGSFDGRFIIEEASHSGGGSGYETSLSVRRVNNNY